VPLSIYLHLPLFPCACPPYFALAPFLVVTEENKELWRLKRRI
jgi:hypothetical protein